MKDVAKKNTNPSTYTYTGERNTKGERHGQGRAVLDNGDIYVGEYKHGVRNGYGEYWFFQQNGAKYAGCYSNNKKNGEGTFLYPDGSRYEGEWKNDKRHGRGTYRYTNGDVYIGEWSADMRHGKGEYHYVDEDMVYTGMWRHGRRSGEGKLMFNDNYFEGHFRHDKMLGPGKYVFKDGRQQYGEYVIEHNRNNTSNGEFVTEWRGKNIQGYV